MPTVIAASLFHQAPAAAAGATSSSATRIVVIAVPDLRWSDLAAMPRLASYAAASSVGDLSVRGEPSVSRCADGSLSFAAGNRADAGGTTSCELSTARWQSLRRSLQADRYGGDIAAFGDALAHAGVTTAAVGDAAVPLLANGSGTADLVVPQGDLAAAVRRAQVVAVVDPGLYAATAASRTAAAGALDVTLARQVAELPAGATVVIAGSSDGLAGGPNLHALIVHGAGWRHVELSSPTTRTSFVQLVDLAPTILGALRLPVPSSMIGRAAHDTSTPAPLPSSFVDADRHARFGRALGGDIRAAFAILAILVMAAVVVAWRTAAGRRRRRLLDTAVWVSRLAVGFPLATYIVQIAPYWRWGLPAYSGLLLLVAVVVAAGVFVAARAGAAAAVVVAAGVTAAALVVDQVAGAPLQLSAPLGNGPLVAGRFHGMGNIAFAVLCGAALVAAGVAGAWLRDRGQRSVGLAVAVIGCLVAMVADVTPTLGDDFGGVLSMTPAVLVLLSLLAGLRLTWRRVLGVVLGVAVLAVGVAAADYSRPASSQTHIGRFFGQVLHGGAGKVIYRKLYSETHSFGNVPVTASVVLLVVAVVVCRREVATLLRSVPGGRESAIAVAVLAVVGTVLNDSGIVVAEFAALLGMLAYVASSPPGLTGASSDRVPDASLG